jgi:hypothetical protein
VRVVLALRLKQQMTQMDLLELRVETQHLVLF